MMAARLGGKKDFYVVPIASNLGVFAVGSNTQSTGKRQSSEMAGEGYSTISFDVPLKMQVLLIMAMRKIRLEGGQFICALRSNQSSARNKIEPGTAYSSTEFMKMISKAHAEMDEIQ